MLLFIQCEKNEVEPEVSIPDEAFLNALIGLGVDLNGDGTISPSEATARYTLDISKKDISDLTGIEAFINLEWLYCRNNQLTSLDLSNNTHLTNISLKSMSSLNMVCAWEVPFPPSGLGVDTTDSPNVYFTTDCDK